MLDAAQGVLEPVRGVVAGVVGEHPFDVDAVGPKEAACAGEESCAGVCPLVGADLRVGKARVGVDGRVDIVESHRALAVRARRVPEDAPAAAGRDPPKLFDVDVHQLARTGGVDTSDHASGGPIEPTQAVEPQAHQDPVHRGRVHAKLPGDARRPELALAAQPADLGLDLGRGPVGGAFGPAGAVTKTRPARLLEPMPPLVGGGTRDAHLGRYMGDRPPGCDAHHQSQPTHRGQPRVSVHGEPPGVWFASQLHTCPGGSPHQAAVNNLGGYYS